MLGCRESRALGGAGREGEEVHWDHAAREIEDSRTLPSFLLRRKKKMKKEDTFSVMHCFCHIERSHRHSFSSFLAESDRGVPYGGAVVRSVDQRPCRRYQPAEEERIGMGKKRR